MQLILLAAPAAFAVGAVTAYLLPERVRSRSPRWRQGLALVGALLAALATAAPTGFALWDAALRAGLGAAIVLLAARAHPRYVLVGTVVVLAASWDDPVAMAMAGAAVGVAVATALTVRRQAPFLTSLAGLLTVQAVLRLPTAGFHGRSGFAAVLGLAPLAVSGYLLLRPEHRRNVNRTAVGVAGAALVAVAVSGVAVVLARPDLDKAVSASRQGLTASRAGRTEEASRQFSGAANAFADARNTIEAVWAAPGRLVPVVAQHLDLLDAAASSGYELAVTGAESAGVAQVESLRVENGRLDLERVRALEEPLASSNSALAAAATALREKRSPWIVAPLARAYERQLADVERAASDTSVALQAVRVLPGLLGGDGPRRYFLAIQQPAELRGSGGIIGNFGELTAVDGDLEVARFGRDGDLNAAAQANKATLTGAPPDYVARYARFTPELVWQNVTVSPDFPSVAATIKVLYPQSGGQPVDGVVSVDPTALAALLRITGPVSVAPWREPITADNAERILHVDQYVLLPTEARVAFLGLVAETVTRKLTTGSLPPPPELARILAPAVRGHHLLLASFTPTEQALFARIGASGALAPRHGETDVVAVVNTNAGGNKLDAFLSREIIYDPGSDGGDRKLAIRLTNSGPADGVPAVVNGSFVGDPPGTNRTYLSVYTPGGLERATLNGNRLPMESETEVDLHVYSAFVVIPPGGTAEIRLTLRPEQPGSTRGRLRIHRQPTVIPDRLTLTGRNQVSERRLTEDLVVARN